MALWMEWKKGRYGETLGAVEVSFVGGASVFMPYCGANSSNI